MVDDPRENSTADQARAVSRAPDGRWKAGTSGNPQGKPRGALRHTTRTVNGLFGDAAGDVAKAIIEAATGGDIAACRIVIDRLVPPAKDAPVEFDMPALATADDIVEAGAGVLSAVGQGELTPDQGERLMGLLDRQRKAIETSALEARLAAIEARILGG